MSNLWDNAFGWEYDRLRDLSPDEQHRIWHAAFGRALKTWWVWIVGCIATQPIWMLGAFARAAVAPAVGWFGGIAIGLCLEYLYFRVLASCAPSLLRPFVRQELSQEEYPNRK